MPGQSRTKCSTCRSEDSHMSPSVVEIAAHVLLTGVPKDVIATLATSRSCRGHNRRSSAPHGGPTPGTVAAQVPAVPDRRDRGREIHPQSAPRLSVLDGDT